MQKAKAAPLGYVVLDEGKPLRRAPGFDGYVSWNSSRHPIAIFPSMKVALRVRLMKFHEYAAQAHQFDPKFNADYERCFNLWLKRAKSISIRRVERDAPSCADIRAMKKARSA